MRDEEMGKDAEVLPVGEATTQLKKLMMERKSVPLLTKTFFSISLSDLKLFITSLSVRKKVISLYHY